MDKNNHAKSLKTQSAIVTQSVASHGVLNELTTQAVLEESAQETLQHQLVETQQQVLQISDDLDHNIVQFLEVNQATVEQTIKTSDMYAKVNNSFQVFYQVQDHWKRVRKDAY